MTCSRWEPMTAKLTLVALAVGIAGCAASQEELMARSRVQQARTVYRQAEADREVQTYAQIPLNEAATSLKEAEGTDDYTDMEAKAYVAEQKARSALAIAEGKRAEKEVQLLTRENTEALLRKRERETQAARSEAAEKTRELESMRQETAARAGEAERLRTQAEARASEAERSRTEAEARAEQARARAETRAREAEQARARAEELSQQLSALKTRETETKTREAEQARQRAETMVQQAQALADERAREAARARAESDQLTRELQRQAMTGSAAGGPDQSRMLTESKAEEAKRLAESSRLDAEKARTESERLAKELSDLKAAQAQAQTQTMTREAEQARQQAETRAEEARALAETRAREAEKARAESERLARELSQQKALQTQVTGEAQKSKAENAQLVKQLRALKARQTPRGVVLTLGDVLFPFGKAALSPQARRNIARLTAFLNSHPNRNVLVEGHTDNVGSEEKNQELSEKRAQAVKKLLTDRGIDERRIAARGYGKSRPVADNSTPHGRQLNRRVEVIVLNEGVPLESASP